MTSNPLFRTFVIAGVAAGGAFFTVSWSGGFQIAAQAAGGAFFTTASSLLGYLGWDARKSQPAPPDEPGGQQPPSPPALSPRPRG